MEDWYAEEFEPFTLTYTWHRRIGDERFAQTVKVVCNTDLEADVHFERMFQREGRDVKYSVD
jgi:hypothetical protein